MSKEVYAKVYVKVRYQVATYSGSIFVTVDEDDDNEIIARKAEAKLRRESGGSLPLGYRNFQVVR